MDWLKDLFEKKIFEIGGKPILVYQVVLVILIIIIIIVVITLVRGFLSHLSIRKESALDRKEIIEENKRIEEENKRQQKEKEELLRKKEKEKEDLLKSRSLESKKDEKETVEEPQLVVNNDTSKVEANETVEESAKDSLITEKKDTEKTSTPTRTRALRYHILYRDSDSKWLIKKEKTERPIKLFNLKKEAIEYAKKLSDSQDVGIVIHNQDGKVRGGYSPDEDKGK
ncbi:MAG: DUF2188 domain-containing protein [Acholeplasmatales bacterium]|jgi:FtsZ-interacting cell division protein ZipA|nr:DUF2188 domain-containing protein [Acholeplasmatales bacterium]